MVLDALRNYNAALKTGDVESQLNFYASSWRSSTGTTKDDMRIGLQQQHQDGTVEEKHFELDNAVVTFEEDTATVDRVPLRSPTGNGTFTFLMVREEDSIWRCKKLFLSNRRDESAENARALREHILRDPARPGYHFANPEGVAMPFDPNGAIYWKGRYHLFYIFQDSRSGERAEPLGTRFKQ